MDICRSIGFCQFKQNWVHKRAACQLVIALVFAWNNFPSKQLINSGESLSPALRSDTSFTSPSVISVSLCDKLNYLTLPVISIPFSGTM